MNDNIDAYLTRYNGFVQMLPNETFLQITNCDSDIAFGGNLLVELINQCQEVILILNVNDTIFINEFTDINGTKQIAYEFGNIGQDYHQELLFLRFTHTVSNNVWYSAGFFITEYLKEETARFEYKNDTYFKGISYDKINVFQTIRLTCFKNDIDPQVESEEYTQISGNKISLRPIITNIEKYIFYVCDFFTYSRLFILLNHDLIYINGYKISNKPAPSKGERIEDSNLFDASFQTNPTEDFRAFQYQLFQTLQVIGMYPMNGNVYLLTGFTGLFLLDFNKEISLISGITAKLYKDNILVYTITPTKNISFNNILDLNFSGYTFANGIYDIVIEENKIFATNCPIEFFGGFVIAEWRFVINSTGVIVTVPSPKTLTFGRTAAEVEVQGTAPITILESLLYAGYANALGNSYDKIRIYTNVTNGTVTVHGMDIITTPIDIPITEVMNLEFWPTGSSNEKPFTSYSTSFDYTVFDSSGNESAPITFDINFTAL